MTCNTRKPSLAASALSLEFIRHWRWHNKSRAITFIKTKHNKLSGGGGEGAKQSIECVIKLILDFHTIDQILNMLVCLLCCMPMPHIRQPFAAMIVGAYSPGDWVRRLRSRIASSVNVMELEFIKPHGLYAHCGCARAMHSGSNAPSLSGSACNAKHKLLR